MMYGENTFVIHVAFDSIKFRYQWLVEPTNLTPKGTKDFLDHFSQRNLLRIKNYIINVEHVDSYTGMIKYNCSGRGLAVGIRQQVQNLVELLAVAPCLQQLQLHLIDGTITKARFAAIGQRIQMVEESQHMPISQTVLSPFTRLYGVRKAKVTGVSPENAEALEQSMTASRVVQT
jgi:hypothetical protein